MKKIKMPFWIQIMVILLAGVLASGVVLLLLWNNTGQQAAVPQQHIVTFAYQDGTVIETKEVTHGKGVFPPELDAPGVFRGWSAGFNNVESDIEVHPVYYSKEELNLFCFDAVYVQEGKRFTLDVRVAGEVNISFGELILEYDPEVLEFLHAENEQKCMVAEKTDGSVIIQFSGDEPIREAMVFSQLCFRAKEKDAYATEIILKTQNVKIVDKGQEIPADHATINNKVFFMQEVG